VSAPSYLNFIDAFDHLAPPEAIIKRPEPVVVVAQLNRLADQVFEPRAMCSFDFNANGPQVVIRPIGGGGCLIEAIEWNLGGTGKLLAYVTAADLAAVLPTTGVQRMETGGPTTRFIAGTRDFEAGVGIGDLPNTGTLPGTVFVAAGNIFVLGRDVVGPQDLVGLMVVREIPVGPFGV